VPPLLHSIYCCFIASASIGHPLLTVEKAEQPAIEWKVDEARIAAAFPAAARPDIPSSNSFERLSAESPSSLSWGAELAHSTKSGDTSAADVGDENEKTICAEGCFSTASSISSSSGLSDVLLSSNTLPAFFEERQDIKASNSESFRTSELILSFLDCADPDRVKKREESLDMPSQRQYVQGDERSLLTFLCSCTTLSVHPFLLRLWRRSALPLESTRRAEPSRTRRTLTERWLRELSSQVS